jgi:hypothetical protein
VSNFFQIEVAGVAITLTNEDAALIVYADCSLCGAEVSFVLNEVHRAIIIERKVENNSVCSAIFPRLEMPSRSSYQNIEIVCREAVPMTVRVTLYKGNIADVWFNAKR